jgi:hypothetical protein
MKWWRPILRYSLDICLKGQRAATLKPGTGTTQSPQDKKYTRDAKEKNMKARRSIYTTNSFLREQDQKQTDIRAKLGHATNNRILQ